MDEGEKDKRSRYAIGIRRRGYGTERFFAEMLWKLNIMAVRVPVSGQGMLRMYSEKGGLKDSLDRSYNNEPMLPDVIAVDEGGKQLYAFQIKDTKTKKKYIEKDDINSLFNFKIFFKSIVDNIRIFVVVKFEGNNWVIKEMFDDSRSCRIDFTKSKQQRIFEWELRELLLRKKEIKENAI